MAIVLGVNAFHAGASAAIVVNGEVKFAIAEERLNRIKYYAGFPTLAIKACLDYLGIDISKVNHLAIGRDSQANRSKKLEYVLKHPLLIPNLLKIRTARNDLNDMAGLIAQECQFPRANIQFVQHNIEHHLAHIASAYFISDWDDAAGITIDGSGDFVTCMMTDCKGTEIKPVHRIYVPDSLGSFYTMICQFIGYDRYGDEGKVMGLAPLGEDSYHDIFQDMIKFEKGNIKLNKKYFKAFGHDQGVRINEKGVMEVNPHYSDYMKELLGEPRVAHSEITKRDKDLAFGVQRRFEDIYFDLLNHLYSLVPNKKVAMAGGCALNSVANGKIFSRTPFRETSIQPAAGDDGLAVGAALYVSQVVLQEGRRHSNTNVYLGNSYTNNEIEIALKNANVSFQHYNDISLVEETVQQICQGKVIGWFQGRSEWGPRALGNRSIICHPGAPSMKDTLNARIKRRESFRPFAPVVMEEKLNEIFEHDYASPYMLHVYTIKEEWRDKLSAVNHVDNTGRLQSVNYSQNPLYYSLIKGFAEKTGIPVLLNTSFNENEPIVETYHEAIDCFLRTKMDVLVVGSYICHK